MDVPHSDLRAATTQEDVIMRKDSTGILRIGAWNVRSLNRVGKLENLKWEMDRLKLDISEVRWKEEQDFWSSEYRIINTKSVGVITGVGMIMTKEIGTRVNDYEQRSDRIIVVKIDMNPTPTTVGLHAN